MKIPTVITQPSPQRSLRASSPNHHSTEFHTCVINYKHANPSCVEIPSSTCRRQSFHSDQKSKRMVGPNCNVDIRAQPPPTLEKTEFHTYVIQYKHANPSLMLKFFLSFWRQSFHSDQKSVGPNFNCSIWSQM